MNLPAESPAVRKWTVLNRLQRRVLGVLVEKSKTTPDVYPMTLTAITTGCNQKSNRSPLMTLDPDTVSSILETLKKLGAVCEVHGDGRVPKFKHQLYDWLGVDRPESAVMTELLLRGHQSCGELRARAARMEESLKDLQQLRPVLDSLLSKGLVLELTPAGRGQVVSHSLYTPEELPKLRQQVESEKLEGGSGLDEGADDVQRSNESDQSPLAARVAQLEQLVSELRSRLERLES